MPAERNPQTVRAKIPVERIGARGERREQSYAIRQCGQFRACDRGEACIIEGATTFTTISEKDCTETCVNLRCKGVGSETSS